MFAVPVDTPLTIPEPAPTLATALLSLTQLPPVGELTRLVVDASQTTVVPLIAAGITFTVIGNVL